MFVFVLQFACKLFLCPQSLRHCCFCVFSFSSMSARSRSGTPFSLKCSLSSVRWMKWLSLFSDSESRTLVVVSSAVVSGSAIVDVFSLFCFCRWFSFGCISQVQWSTWTCGAWLLWLVCFVWVALETIFCSFCWVKLFVRLGQHVKQPFAPITLASLLEGLIKLCLIGVDSLAIDQSDLAVECCESFCDTELAS